MASTNFAGLGGQLYFCKKEDFDPNNPLDPDKMIPLSQETMALNAEVVITPEEREKLQQAISVVPDENVAEASGEEMMKTLAKAGLLQKPKLAGKATSVTEIHTDEATLADLRQLKMHPYFAEQFSDLMIHPEPENITRLPRKWLKAKNRAEVQLRERGYVRNTKAWRKYCNWFIRYTKRNRPYVLHRCTMDSHDNGDGTCTFTLTGHSED